LSKKHKIFQNYEEKKEDHENIQKLLFKKKMKLHQTKVKPLDKKRNKMQVSKLKKWS
jgi:hypothetical protein